MIRLSTTLLALVAAGCFAPACSLRYDADELPSKSDDADTGSDADASDGEDPPDAAISVADAAVSVIDAAPLPDAAVTPGDCGDVDEMCCETDPICGFGNEFIECDEETSTCKSCGTVGEKCCETGPECTGGLGCVRLLGIETCVSL